MDCTCTRLGRLMFYLLLFWSRQPGHKTRTARTATLQAQREPTPPPGTGSKSAARLRRCWRLRGACLDTLECDPTADRGDKCSLFGFPPHALPRSSIATATRRQARAVANRNLGVGTPSTRRDRPQVPCDTPPTTAPAWVTEERSPLQHVRKIADQGELNTWGSRPLRI